jgi:aminoglycoside 6-adenylyltransferase
MQFKDGVRIDLSFHPVEVINKSVNLDSLTKVLLDKDQIIKPLVSSNDSSHYVGKPTAEEFNKVLNNTMFIVSLSQFIPARITMIFGKRSSLWESWYEESE